jgi:hypothetical protein
MTRTAKILSSLGDVVLTRAALVRAICLSISLLGTLAPYRALAEDGDQLPAKATKELPPQVLAISNRPS